MIVSDIYLARDTEGRLTCHFIRPKRFGDLWFSRLVNSSYIVRDDDFLNNCNDDLRSEIQNLKFEDKPIKAQVELKIAHIEKI